MTAAKKREHLAEIEAAIHVRMSPELLRWFTANPPKFGESRTLPFTEEDGEYFYRQEDLAEFDSYLREPWPIPPKGTRPNVPQGIRQELIREAHHRCAFCDISNHGEGAHIDPVHKTRCNHPHNLIWSCRNHHREYDMGHKVETDLTREHVQFMKEILLKGRLRIWQVERRTISGYLSAIEALDEILDSLTKENNRLLAAAVLPQAHALLQATTTSASKDKATAAAHRKFAARIAALPAARSSEELRAVVRTADDAANSFFKETGLAPCPLCKGSGEHNRYRCRVCAGEGAVPAAILGEIDLRPFEQVVCPLCDGTTEHNRDECPVCFGIGTTDRGRRDSLDLSPFRQVVCPVCHGSRVHNRRECPNCRGLGTIDQGVAENLDLAPYRQVTCPVCDGTRIYLSSECSACDGQGTMDQGRADLIDLGRYSLVDCPVCGGRGIHRRRNCHACNGTGRMAAGIAENFDTSPYRSVVCPACSGTGRSEVGECRLCQGLGEVDQGAAENFERRDQ